MVWAFSGNSIGSCMDGADGKPIGGEALFDKYRADTERAIDAADAAGVPFVLASPPAPHLPGDVWEQLDTVYRSVAGAHPTVQYADAGVAISPEGQFVDTQRCLPFEQRIPEARQASRGRWDDHRSRLRRSLLPGAVDDEPRVQDLFVGRDAVRHQPLASRAPRARLPGADRRGEYPTPVIPRFRVS